MRHAGKHLTHGGKFLRLNQLFFEAFQVRYVATREHHTFNFFAFVTQRAEVEKNLAPFTLLVAYAHFK